MMALSHQKDLHMMAMSHIVNSYYPVRSAQMQWIKFQLRLPSDVRSWLELDAERSDRSMNSQVIAILRERMNQQVMDGVERKPSTAN